MRQIRIVQLDKVPLTPEEQELNAFSLKVADIEYTANIELSESELVALRLEMKV